MRQPLHHSYNLIDYRTERIQRKRVGFLARAVDRDRKIFMLLTTSEPALFSPPESSKQREESNFSVHLLRLDSFKKKVAN